MIDRSGTWWTGTGPEDIEEYLREYTSEGYPADRFERSSCVCGGSTFRLHADADEGCARRTCVACGAERFIGDSGVVVGDSQLRAVQCPCRGDEYEIAVGFSHRDDETVRWISVGVRCVRCGVLGCPAEWSIDYAPTSHLYELAKTAV